MIELPDRPFLTEDFSPDGAGIDFLGLRWVNLRILDEYLLPGVNNATEDFGIYCLAAWLPWKFKTICREPKQFRLSNFTKFRQAVEVAMSFVSREDSPATKQFGPLHRRIGAQQKLNLPSRLDFARVRRTESTSIYAAPLYGPSLRYLGLVPGPAMADDGTSTGIPMTSEDAQTMTVVAAVEKELASSRGASVIGDMADQEFDARTLDELGMHGLHPARCRDSTKKIKQAFLGKLLPNDEHNGRTLTAQVVIRTLRSRPGLDVDTLRDVWNTGIIRQGKRQTFSEPRLSAQRDRWQMLMIRQYQRYILEEFLRCFELAVLAGCRSLEEITDHSLRHTVKTWKRSTKVREILFVEAEPISKSLDQKMVAERWVEMVHFDHPSYIGKVSLENDEEEGCVPAIRMLARWWFGSILPLTEQTNSELAALGGEDRISMRWFLRWLTTLQMERRYHNIVSAARRHFGSWNKAVLAAGVKPTKLLRVIPWNEERVIEAILTRALRNESLAARVVEPRSLVEAGHRFFGGWAAAVTAAGLDLATTEPPPRGTKRSRLASARASGTTKAKVTRVPWNKERVVASLLARLREQKPIYSNALARDERSLYHAARRYFGSWNQAMLAAGLDPAAHRRGPVCRSSAAEARPRDPVPRQSQ